MRYVIRVAIVVCSFVVMLGLAHPAQARGYVPSDETKVHNMVNETRATKGLSKLVRNDKLVTMARDQADRMEAKGNIFHNPDLSGEIGRSGLQWQRVGENVGMGPNVDLIQKAFLDSPGHYQNIVRPDYNSMGVGVVDGGDGKRYVVQVFADLAGTQAIAPVPAKAAVAPAAPATQVPATQAPPAAPASAQPQAPAVSAPSQTASPAPKPQPSADPNALTGGYVVEIERSDQDRYLAVASGPAPTGFGRIIDALAFWS